MLDALSDVEICDTHDGSDAAAVPPYGHLECLADSDAEDLEDVAPDLLADAGLGPLELLEDAAPDDLAPQAVDVDALRAVLPDTAKNPDWDFGRQLRQLSYSSRHHLEIKLRRTQQKQEKIVERAQKQLAAIDEVWSRSCLARGERLQTGTIRRRPRKPDKKIVWQHPRAWTIRGTLREAFRAIGMVVSDAAGTRKTRRELGAISFVALSHRNYVDSQVNCTWLYNQAGVLNMNWFFAVRALDATPIKIRCGQMRPLLAPMAKYWWLWRGCAGVDWQARLFLVWSSLRRCGRKALSQM